MRGSLLTIFLVFDRSSSHLIGHERFHHGEDIHESGLDQIVNHAAHIHYMFGGQAKVTLVVRMPQGAGHHRRSTATGSLNGNRPCGHHHRAGLAYPMRARIEGSGPGAVRYCEFSTGPFVEPIVTWDEHAPIARRGDRVGVYYGFKTMNVHIHLLEALAA